MGQISVITNNNYSRDNRSFSAWLLSRPSARTMTFEVPEYILGLTEYINWIIYQIYADKLRFMYLGEPQNIWSHPTHPFFW